MKETFQEFQKYAESTVQKTDMLQHIASCSYKSSGSMLEEEGEISLLQ